MAPERYRHTSGFTRTSSDAFAETPTIQVHRQGTVLGIRARAVCRICNGGWMSGLEQRAKPVLLTMMNASRPDSVTTLTPGDAETVAAWAVKTAWMSEESTPGPRATTPQMRQALRNDLRPPKYSNVWAARHDGSLDFNIKQSAVDAARQDRSWDSTDVRHVLWTCLTFRGIGLLACTVDGWGVPPPRRDPLRWTRLWPVGSTVIFPPVTTVSDRDVLMAVVHQPNLRLPQVQSFIRDQA